MNQPPACPICRETHEPERTLSFDGCGINACDMYRTRLATFIDRGAETRELGPKLAASLKLLAVVERLFRSINGLNATERATNRNYRGSPLELELSNTIKQAGEALTLAGARRGK